ncbi:DUF2141 domain-containing protein [Sphingomonas sp.]|uniref:DUF2141 domain-containing protein n=1 Tax=Sphingomonas sp. TaxID=28214 RepID=UPI002D7FBE75|nr:DUF2141 domain-containing protein [Sphingomonas sp.]HEU0043037.1 DUF2141 domain-containing protein [Sphingomonas sp.]
MKPARLIALALFAGLPATASAQVLGEDACVGGAPAILVQVVGLKGRRGELKLELYPANEQDFLRDDRDLLREGKLFRRIRVPTPTAGDVRLCMRVPRPGRYALLFTHNRDGKNKFNFWVDGAGFASAQKLGRKRPRLHQAIVDVPAGVQRITVRAQYLRGFSGFGPVKS